ncbi:MAG: hypothetical protein OEZ02_07620 [Anaerolineae bacterium]|nr:hypothetical protein [Anaerolineae bacterium]
MKFKVRKASHFIFLGVGVVFLLVSFYFVGNYTYEVVTLEMTRLPPILTKQAIQYRLSPSTQEDLCHQLGFSNDDPFCIPGASWTKNEFHSVLNEYFLGRDSAPITFEEFDEILSKYRYRCEEPHISNVGTERFRCIYKIHYSVFEIYAAFEDGFLERLYYPTNGS